jgi:hypothetical protein
LKREWNNNSGIPGEFIQRSHNIEDGWDGRSKDENHNVKEVSGSALGYAFGNDILHYSLVHS